MWTARKRERLENNAPVLRRMNIVKGRGEEEGKPYDVLVVSLNAASYNATT